MITSKGKNENSDDFKIPNIDITPPPNPTPHEKGKDNKRRNMPRRRSAAAEEKEEGWGASVGVVG